MCLQSILDARYKQHTPFWFSEEGQGHPGHLLRLLSCMSLVPAGLVQTSFLVGLLMLLLWKVDKGDPRALQAASAGANRGAVTEGSSAEKPFPNVLSKDKHFF